MGAYLAAKANNGTAGIDGQTLEDFEADLKNDLYKIWNRLSSGSYFPPPVRRVEIPRSNGKEAIGYTDYIGSNRSDGDQESTGTFSGTTLS